MALPHNINVLFYQQKVTKDPNLRERHLGDLQGVLFPEAAKINPEAYEAFVSEEDLEIPVHALSLSLSNTSHGGTLDACEKKN
ncbi:hypothetical protein BUALT_Bualt04G0115100 [Buddleja alternifolia]|uniref:Uncharacterized protein n=1 Tax=Buddleja alternifolia TaxID=168488 RepID=A0AAV6XSJ0_9LAMI|nr:hypothetical protein BUALT_Bualt04G0115100 [Buddleja alternifolia]